MSYEFITVETKGRVGLVTLNRPKQLNALNAKLMQELGQAMQAFDADPGIGAMLLTGSEKAFAAGADIDAMKSFSFMDAYTQDYITRDWEHILRVRKPVIAAVAGYALGGGNEVAMMCDIVIAADNARFGQPEINLGLLPGFGGTQRLLRLAGRGAALELCLTGAQIDAARAYALGLVHRVVAADALEAETQALAEQLAAAAPQALRGILDAILIGGECGLQQGLDYETQAFALCTSTEDMREGTRAFLERRKPSFRGH